MSPGTLSYCGYDPHLADNGPKAASPTRFRPAEPVRDSENGIWLPDAPRHHSYLTPTIWMMEINVDGCCPFLYSVLAEPIMGKRRDHRELRRRRHEDDFTFLADAIPEPSYFQRLAPAPAQTVDAEVLWFNAEKGFGFVRTAEGTEAYLHIRTLEIAKEKGVSEGMHLKVSTEHGPKGYQVSQVFEVGDVAVRPVADDDPAEEGQISRSCAGRESKGTVRWYNSDKGFGFISPENGEKDIFVHATALVRSGITVLVEGQKVFVEYELGRKGLEVRSLRVISEE